MSARWSDQVAQHLTDPTRCPRCSVPLDSASGCRRCGVVLDGADAEAVWSASVAAAEAVRNRQRLIDALPTRSAMQALSGPAAASWGSTVADMRSPVRSAAPAGAAPAPAVAAGPAAAAVGAGPAPALSVGPSPAPAESTVSVQSVLAVAGAALVAVAAIVFTFLNPDLTDFGTRSLIIGVVTAAFVGSALLLRRRGLDFSAESLGALGMVFLALDVWAIGEAADGVASWVAGGIGTLVASAVVIVVAVLVRLRTWLWSGVVGLVITPALFGYAAGTMLVATLGHVACAIVAVAVHDLLRRLAPRFGSRLAADHGTATTLHLLAVAVIAVQLMSLGELEATPRVLATSGVLLALAGTALVDTRNQLSRTWSVIAGTLATVAVALLPLALRLGEGSVWFVALIPAAGAAAVVALCAMRLLSTVRRGHLAAGGLVVVGVLAVPAVFLGASVIGGLLVQVGGLMRRVISQPGGAVTPNDDALVAIGGVTALAVALAARALLPRRAGGEVDRRSPVWWTSAVAVAIAGLLPLIGWSRLVLPAQMAVGVTIAVGLALGGLVLRGRTHPLATGARRPLIVGAHLAIALTALASWAQTEVAIVTGAVAVAVVLLLATTLPARLRAGHVGVAYAYGLLVVATAFDHLGVETIAVLCLTTSAAALVALAATVIDRVDARSWYAILIVTSVPFLIGVASVIGVRSGWTALSTALIGALALTLLLTRRAGLTSLLRAAAGGIVVPAVAVVIISLGAELLRQSASPVTLPIIAVVVAVTASALAAIASGLRRHGLDERETGRAVLAIELSMIATGVIAVLLALVREAAGLPTSFVVLLLLGIGAAGAALLSGRRYGWALAAACWTGALWCVWALAGIDVVEAYVLPPALGAVVVGVILLLRGRPGVALAASGLACAIVPTLVLLALVGSGDGNGDASGVPWRSAGLLAVVVLLVGAAAVTRTSDTPGTGADGRVGALRRRLAPLAVPLLLAAVVAGAAGAAQAVRIGARLDPVTVRDVHVILPALAWTAAAVLGMTVATRLLQQRARLLPAGHRIHTIAASRWLYVPALAALVVGPWTAIRRDWLPIWTLWGLMLALLAGMIVVVAIARRRPTALPAAPVIYAAAWITGVVGWSERDLRVEWFSLPLGIAVVIAGIIGLAEARRRDRLEVPVEPALRGGTLTDWPNGFRGSWRLLGPGIALTLLPSVTATGTDPQTWRAILVIVLALGAILIGSSRRLAAPFVLGLIVLPIENVVVFVVQIGRSIGALPWWITLATAGAVLLVIAVGSERRSAQGRGVAARLRELE